jgi:four helix bundle protein
MSNSTLRARTRSLAIEIIRFSTELPFTEEARVIKRQLLRSGTSPGASCREASRSRSNAEMISKLETALQELDETLYWMDLLIEADITPRERLEPLMREVDELIAMAVASVRTIKQHKR